MGHSLLNGGRDRWGNCRLCKREYRRFYDDAKRRDAGIASRQFTTRHTPGGAASLPISPFREWLADRLQTEAIGVLARELGTSTRRIDAWLKEQDTVHIDTVDRAVGATTLNELYPVAV